LLQICYGLVKLVKTLTRAAAPRTSFVRLSYDPLHDVWTFLLRAFDECKVNGMLMNYEEKYRIA